MKHTLYIILALLCVNATKAQTVVTDTAARNIVDGVSVSDLKMEHTGNFLTVDMILDLKELDVDGNRAVLLTPRLVNADDSLELPSVGIYGRRRYYYYVRNGVPQLTGSSEQSFRASEKPEQMEYSQILPYEKWMNGARLSVYRSDYGCCNSLVDEQIGLVGVHTEIDEFFPDLLYVTPQADTVKNRSLEGRAYIDFRVDKTNIDPTYRRNTAELGKIFATIDSVRSDVDVTIKTVWLKGYASPESPYSHNRDLAIGRTAALKNHIQQLYKFDEGMIQTDYEPEDWDGLRRYVDASNINHRTEILALIDSDMEPDAKERRIKVKYPVEYKFLLDNCYPALRHTDYRIAYNIRTYSDVEEIKRLLRTRPQNLSLNEFYLVAQQYKQGTAQFTEVFETAVRMYPKDEIANLNAANTAIRRDDFETAARYLEKAGNSPEAIYARAALAIRKEDYDTARLYLNQAKAAGLEKAAQILEELSERTGK